MQHLQEENVLRHRVRLRVDSRDVDLFQRARPAAICAMMQESAWRHAESLGFGYSHLARDGLFWVLSRIVVEWQGQPGWGDELDLDTWPAGHKGAFALRDFRFSGENGVLINATTAWLVVQRNNRRPVRPRDVLPLPPDCGGVRALDEVPPRIPDVDESGDTRRVAASWSDIDLNGHVNNTRYVDWMLDGFDEDFHRRHLPRRMEVNFLAEMHLGEFLELEYRETPDHAWLVAGRRPGGEPVARCRFFWDRVPLD